MEVEDGAVHMVRNAGSLKDLSVDPEYLATGGNSGFQALNLAVLSGAKTVVLIGFDANDPVDGQPTHWFGEHPVAAAPGAFKNYRESFSRAAVAIRKSGVRVINCSPESAITAFEKMGLAEALA